MDFDSFKKTILDKLNQNFRKICVARVNPDLVSDVVVSCYGSESKLSEVSNISIPASRTLVIKPYDVSIIEDIQSSLKKQKPEFSPVLSGDTLKIILNPPTEETRKKAVKQAKEYLEHAKISVRNMRKSCMDEIKNSESSEDDKKRLTAQIEADIKKLNSILDLEFQSKEKELMTI